MVRGFRSRKSEQHSKLLSSAHALTVECSLLLPFRPHGIAVVVARVGRQRNATLLPVEAASAVGMSSLALRVRTRTRPWYCFRLSELDRTHPYSAETCVGSSQFAVLQPLVFRMTLISRNHLGL